MVNFVLKGLSLNYVVMNSRERYNPFTKQEVVTFFVVVLAARLFD